MLTHLPNGTECQCSGLSWMGQVGCEWLPSAANLPAGHHVKPRTLNIVCYYLHLFSSFRFFWHTLGTSFNYQKPPIPEMLSGNSWPLFQKWHSVLLQHWHAPRTFFNLCLLFSHFLCWTMVQTQTEPPEPKPKVQVHVQVQAKRGQKGSNLDQTRPWPVYMAPLCCIEALWSPPQEVPAHVATVLHEKRISIKFMLVPDFTKGEPKILRNSFSVSSLTSYIVIDTQYWLCNQACSLDGKVEKKTTTLLLHTNEQRQTDNLPTSNMLLTGKSRDDE